MVDLGFEAAASAESAFEIGTVSAPEFRFDSLTREWVAITGSRQDRPNRPRLDECPFCVGGLEAQHPYVVKAFPNRWPPMSPGDPLDLTDPAVGAQQPAAL
jgi:UDPglucose--hexose-1-phosphate uridylyltransferase